MDLMIGTIDTRRLRKDLVSHFRKTGNLKSPAVRNKIFTAEMADEQQLMAIAKEEGIELRRYVR